MKIAKYNEWQKHYIPKVAVCSWTDFYERFIPWMDVLEISEKTGIPF